MKILIDLSNCDKAYTHYLTLEKRLGHEIYFMKGVEWAENGYWDYEPEQAGLFLEQFSSGYMRKHDWHFRTCTFEEFKEMHFDVFWASIWPNEFSMMRLRDDWSPDTKVVRQDGNPSEEVFENSCRNFVITIPTTNRYLLNFTENIIEAGRNWVFTHQEFDDVNEFHYFEPKNYDKIQAYQNGLIYSGFIDFWNTAKELLPDFKFTMYGCLSDSGIGFDIGKELAESMADSTFIWQTKANEGCGGFLTWNSFALGRPLICKKSNFDDHMLDMLIDGETCIDLDARDMKGNADFIRECSKPERYNEMSKKCYEMYKKFCDYDAEAIAMQNFLDNLQ